jgi:hypothetical protein
MQCVSKASITECGMILDMDNCNEHSYELFPAIQSGLSRIYGCIWNSGCKVALPCSLLENTQCNSYYANDDPKKCFWNRYGYI